MCYGSHRMGVGLTSVGETAVHRSMANGKGYSMETWEEIAPRLAGQAGIATPQHELIEVAGKAVMLSRRFDRAGATRIPFLHLREGFKTTSTLPGRCWMQPRVGELEKASSMGGLVGGIVTRAGPVTGADVAPVDQETLARLHLRPVFVGIERDLIRAAIDAEPEAVRNCIADTVSPDEFARPDRAGGWIIPLGQERRIISST
jgi:hypothetical protein